MLDLENYKVGDPIPEALEPLAFGPDRNDRPDSNDESIPVDKPHVEASSGKVPGEHSSQNRLSKLIARFADHPERLSEYPSSESEVDMTTRTSIRDILFSYTGDVDVTKYRIPAPPQASVELTREGINYDKGDVDPEFAAFAIRETSNDKEGLMDSRDIINQEAFHQNVFRRQEELRSRQAQRRDASQSGAGPVSAPQAGSAQ